MTPNRTLALAIAAFAAVACGNRGDRAVILGLARLRFRRRLG
jgi:hypothetical protein